MSSGEWLRALPHFAHLRGGTISLWKLPLEIWVLLKSGPGRVSLFPFHPWGGGNPQLLTLEPGPPRSPPLMLLPAPSIPSRRPCG